MNRLIFYDNNGNPLPDPFLIDEIEKMLTEYKVTIRATSGERLIITDQVSGEEYVIDDLGYPL